MPGAYTTVRARRGRLVHLTTIGAALAGITLCNRPCDGWFVADAAPTCPRCLACEGGAPP